MAPAPRPLLTDDPTEGTVGPIIGTIVVIAILVAGAGVAIQGIVDRVQDRRAAAAAASSTLPANVPAQSVTIE
jgi:FlaG/FlaF family flagellin (archaellin)